MSASFKPQPASLSVKIGNWFEARATGWAVVAVPVILVLTLAAPLLVRILA